MFSFSYFLSRFSAFVARRPTAAQIDVLLGFGVERTPVEAAPGRDHLHPGAGEKACDVGGRQQSVGELDAPAARAPLVWANSAVVKDGRQQPPLVAPAPARALG